MSDLWNNDDDNHLSGSNSGMEEARDVPGRSHLGSSLIIEGVSPPLAWAEPSHPFTPLGDLSSSQRFDMDAISDGGMCMILGNKSTRTTCVGGKQLILPVGLISPFR